MITPPPLALQALRPSRHAGRKSFFRLLGLPASGVTFPEQGEQGDLWVGGTVLPGLEVEVPRGRLRISFPRFQSALQVQQGFRGTVSASQLEATLAGHGPDIDRTALDEKVCHGRAPKRHG